MKKTNILILPWMILGLAGWTLGGIGHAQGQSDRLRKDIDSHLADLRQAESRLDAANADLASAKQDRAAMERRVYGPSEMSALRTRMDKDRTDVQTYTAQMLDDITFLQNNWGVLSEAERDTVKRASRSLE